MIGRLRRLFAVGVIGGALLTIGLISAGPVAADVDPVAFQKLGCNVNDYSCYYARLYGGVPRQIPYCDNSGCAYNNVGDPYYSAPYAVNPYVNPYANPYYAAYPSDVTGYVYPYGSGPYVPSFNGGITPALASNR
jgi:hypothetical protein